MKKLNKKMQQKFETIEAYTFCTYCRCTCYAANTGNTNNARASTQDRMEIM